MLLTEPWVEDETADTTGFLFLILLWRLGRGLWDFNCALSAKEERSFLEAAHTAQVATSLLQKMQWSQWKPSGHLVLCMDFKIHVTTLGITSEYSKKWYAKCTETCKDTELGIRFCWNTLVASRLCNVTDVLYMLFQLKTEDTGYASGIAS